MSNKVVYTEKQIKDLVKVAAKDYRDLMGRKVKRITGWALTYETTSLMTQITLVVSLELKPRFDGDFTTANMCVAI